MVKLKHRLLGYYRIKFDTGRIGDVAGLLLKLGICASVTAEGECVLTARDASRLFDSGGREYVCEISDILGLPGALKRNRFRVASLVAVLIVGFLYFFTAGRVWDVRIDGNESLSAYKIEEQLRSAGLDIGSSWQSIDKSKVEASVLASCPEISWISINRKGGVAYIEIRETEGGEEDTSVDGIYSNLVADRDCVIEDITVRAGQAVVKIGDVVKKGDILISGIIVSELGTTLCHADGSVIGTATGEVEVFVPREETRVGYKKPKLAALSLEIFGFSINIYKNYGNSKGECDIIKENEDLVLFDKYRIPLGVGRSYVAAATEYTVSYTDSELVNLATERMKRSMHTYLSGADLLKLRTEGEYRDGGYLMRSEVVYTVDVGTDSPIETEGG